MDLTRLARAAAALATASALLAPSTALAVDTFYNVYPHPSDSGATMIAIDFPLTVTELSEGTRYSITWDARVYQDGRDMGQIEGVETLNQVSGSADGFAINTAPETGESAEANFYATGPDVTAEYTVEADLPSFAGNQVALTYYVYSQDAEGNWAVERSSMTPLQQVDDILAEYAQAYPEAAEQFEAEAAEVAPATDTGEKGEAKAGLPLVPIALGALVVGAVGAVVAFVMSHRGSE